MPRYTPLSRPAPKAMSLAAERFQKACPELGLHRQKLSKIWNGHQAATLAQAIAILGDRAPADAENLFLYLGELNLTLEDLTRTSIPSGLPVARVEVNGRKYMVVTSTRESL